MRLFSAVPCDSSRDPERIGRQVQVGNNFMIVYPSEKYPTREVLFNDPDYVRNIQLSQQSNSGKYKRQPSMQEFEGRDMARF